MINQSVSWLIVEKLMLTDILSRTILKLLQIIVQILDTAFLSPHVEAYGQHTSDFLFVLSELFLLCYGCGATSQYGLEIGVFEGGGSVSAKFSRSRGRPPRIILARIDRPVNALQLCRWQYSHKETM